MQEIMTTYYFKGENRLKKYIHKFTKSPGEIFYVPRFSDIEVLAYKQAIQLCLVLVCLEFLLNAHHAHAYAH